MYSTVHYNTQRVCLCECVCVVVVCVCCCVCACFFCVCLCGLLLCACGVVHVCVCAVCMLLCMYVCFQCVCVVFFLCVVLCLHVHILLSVCVCHCTDHSMCVPFTYPVQFILQKAYDQIVWSLPGSSVQCAQFGSSTNLFVSTSHISALPTKTIP